MFALREKGVENKKSYVQLTRLSHLLFHQKKKIFRRHQLHVFSCWKNLLLLKLKELNEHRSKIPIQIRSKIPIRLKHPYMIFRVISTEENNGHE